jgi:hypothetical protein
VIVVITRVCGVMLSSQAHTEERTGIDKHYPVTPRNVPQKNCLIPGIISKAKPGNILLPLRKNFRLTPEMM